MSRNSSTFFALTVWVGLWILLELLLFALVAWHLYHQVIVHSVFRFPYSLFFSGLLRGYWWVIVVSAPVLSWVSLKLSRRVKSIA